MNYIRFNLLINLWRDQENILQFGNYFKEMACKLEYLDHYNPYPPIKSKNISFYLPDTFAPTDDAYPKILKNFQSFNLKICNENKALSNKISNSFIFDFLRLLISGA